MSNVFLGNPIITVTGIAITTGVASAGGAIPVNSAGEIPRYIRVTATAAAYFRMGPGAQTAIVGDMMIQPGDSQLLAVPRGVTHVAAIQVAAAGICQVSPCENS